MSTKSTKVSGMGTSMELTGIQQRALKDFYGKTDVSVSLNKVQRRAIWDDFVANRDISNIAHLENEIPALYIEMSKALENDRNIQPAVFSECVYTQALAKKYELDKFEAHSPGERVTSESLTQNASKLGELTLRYSYSNQNGTQRLYQAGGASGVDCAYHKLKEDEIVWIEMKEPYARTSEPDLPKYREDGYIISSEGFEKTYPQFSSMLEEQVSKRLNVFEHIGNNIADFSSSSIEKAVTENYSGEKLAHVICTEDEDGVLVMLPSNHVGMWAKLEGEIRPSGRNSYKVWTPLRLMALLRSMNADIQDGEVRIPMIQLKTSNARGSRNVSRYKINPIFFVRESKLQLDGKFGVFSLNSVMQLNPSITAKMNFKGLSVSKVKDFYLGQL